MPESINLRVWFARGFTARMKYPETDLRAVTNFKGDEQRQKMFNDGWHEAENEIRRVQEQIASTHERQATLRHKEHTVWASVRQGGKAVGSGT